MPLSRNIKNAIRFWIFTLLVSLLSCTDSHKLKEAVLLEDAAQLIEKNPNQAFDILRKINIDRLHESDYYYYILLEVRALERIGKNIASFETPVSKAKDYFIGKKNPAKAAFACFCMAKVFEAQKNQTKTLHYYLQADGWAEKASYNIPHFLYSFIPYNAAIACYYQSNYQEGIHYVNKALAHIEIEGGNFVHKIRALEVKGICFKNTECFDSALACYQEALSIASKHNDSSNKNRIVLNLLNLERKNIDNQEVINKANSLLQNLPNKDSITIGTVHIMLAESYFNLKNIDKADIHAEKAKELLTHANEYIQLALYNTLAKVEAKKKGRRVSNYQEQYERLQNELEAKRAKEKAELNAEVQTQLSKQEGELLANSLAIKSYYRSLYQQTRSSRQKLVTVLFAILIGVILATYLIQQARRRFYRDLVSEDLKLAISRQSYLNQLKDLSDSEKAAEIADDLTHIIAMSPTLDKCFGKLYHRLKKIYPALDDKELMVCWLKASRVANNADIMKLTNLSEEEYMRTYFIMQVKIREAGHSYTLRSIVKTLFKDEEFYH